jgi:rRNA maturation RNase YbeY
MAISFHQEDTSFTPKHKLKLKACIQASVETENFICGRLNVVFCSDEYLLKMNQQFLQHNYYTDIITFDYSKNGILHGDLFISQERVSDNAQKNKVTFENELYRVIIHGVMHLAGYKDKSKSHIKQMRTAEEKHLQIWSEIIVGPVSRGTKKSKKNDLS